MNESTCAIIFEGKTIDDIITCCKTEAYDGYVLPVNIDWNAIVLKDYKTINEEATKVLSEKLKTFTINLTDYEDFGWGFSLLSHGKELVDFSINYSEDSNIEHTREKIEKLSNSLLDLNEILTNTVVFEGINSFIKSYNLNPELIYNGAHLFFEAFGFQIIQGLSYDKLSELLLEDLDEIEAVLINKKKKKSQSFKQIVIKVVEKKLNQLGYYLSKERQSNDELGFYTEINGFKMGLVITKSRYNNKFRAELYAPTIGKKELYLITEGKEREFEYHNEDKLTVILNEILNQFIAKGNKWLDNQKIDVFDPEKVYAEYVDGFLEQYFYKRISTSNNLLNGGQVIYNNGDSNIYFYHGLSIAFVKCGVRDKAGYKELIEIAVNHIYEEQLRKGSYKDGDEYEKRISFYLKVLKELYLKM